MTTLYEVSNPLMRGLLWQFIAVIMLFVGLDALGQATRSISGNVKDETGEGLPWGSG